VEEVPQTSVSLIQREEEDVARIIFNYNGEQTYMTPHVDSAGRIEWSYSAAGDYVLVQHFVREKARPAWLLTAIDTAHENFEEVGLEAFGLQTPWLVVESIFHDGSNHTLRVGSRTTDYQHYFLMMDDNPEIYLINAILGERLRSDAGDMLDLTIPFVNIQDAEYVRLAERGTAPIVLGPRSEDMPAFQLDGFLQEMGGEHLVMHEPIFGMNLSTSRLMENIVQPMSQLRFRELAELRPENLADFGLENPILEYVIRSPITEVHFKFGNMFTRDGMELVYVMLGDRPHVFITESEHLQTVIGTSPLEIADRFLALVGIADVESVSIDTLENSFNIVMNHTFETFDIAPVVNGISVEDSAVRNAFMQIISLSADADIEPFTPQGAPEIIITHHQIDNPDTQIRLYSYNANFMAASIDGGEAIFVTNRRAVERLIDFLEGLVS